MFLRLLQYDLLKQRPFYDRDKYEHILRDPYSSLGKNVKRLIDFCVILAVVMIIFESVAGIGDRYHLEFLIVDVLISIVFALEYTYRFMRSRKKWKFVFKIFNIIDLLSFLPFFIGLIFIPTAGVDLLKILRVFRLLRLYEVSSKSPLVLGFMKTLREYHSEYKAIFSIFVSTLIVVSAFVYYFEFPSNPDFSNIPQSLWWGIVTMTTVGFGDMVPQTLGGKLLGSILILLGPVLVAVLGSITILVFMDVAEAERHALEKICITCKRKNRIDANFCDSCGSQHFTSHDEEEKKTLFQKIFSKK